MSYQKLFIVYQYILETIYINILHHTVYIKFEVVCNILYIVYCTYTYTDKYHNTDSKPFRWDESYDYRTLKTPEIQGSKLPAEID